MQIMSREVRLGGLSQKHEYFDHTARTILYVKYLHYLCITDECQFVAIGLIINRKVIRYLL